MHRKRKFNFSLKEFFKKPKNKKIVMWIILAVVIIVGISVFAAVKSGKSKESDSSLTSAAVTRGDVELTISGSGAVEPYERYEIIPLVNGEITDCPYEVGDYVEKGEVIYTFDTSDALLDMQKQNNSMEKSTITYNEALENSKKLTVSAGSSGRITSLEVAAGDEVRSGDTIAKITYDVNLSVKLPFNKEQISHIKVGQTASLSSSAQMSSFSGKVTYVDKTPSADEGGSAVYYVTVGFTNPGAVSEGTILGGEINGQVSPGGATVSFGEEKQIKAELDGKVSKLYVGEGAYVSKNQAIASLSSEDLDNTLQKSKLEYDDAKLSLQSQQNKLDDYTITAPISGTVLTKTSKKGDTIDKTNASVTMMVIGDVSKLKFNLSVDELDIAKVSVGQKVVITSDAVEGKEFEGEITELSMEGEASNGVTTYNAVVTINEPGELKPSMNVDAVVVLDSVSDALRIPSAAVKEAMGHSYVFVKDDGKTPKSDDKKKDSKLMLPESGSNDKSGNTDKSGRSDNSTGSDGSSAAGRPSGADRSSASGSSGAGEMPGGAPPQMPDGEQQNSGDSGNMPSAPSGEARVPQAPDGYKAVEIETGLAGDDFTEVLSGLNEGQEIFYQQSTSSGNNMMFGSMGGPGGMGGGPGGGMGGPGGGGGAPGGGPGGR